MSHFVFKILAESEMNLNPVHVIEFGSALIVLVCLDVVATKITKM